MIVSYGWESSLSDQQQDGLNESFDNSPNLTYLLYIKLQIRVLTLKYCDTSRQLFFLSCTQKPHISQFHTNR